jgi:hypothetical protein
MVYKQVKYISICTLFSISIMAVSQTQGQQLLQYSNPNLGLVLIYPGSFNPLEQENNGVRFNQADAQYNMGNILEVAVFRDPPLGEYVPLSTYVSDKIGYLQQIYNNLRLTDVQQIPLGQAGIPGAVVGFAGENNGIQFIGIVGIFLHNGIPYTLHYISDNAVDFRNHYGEASLIINTLMLDGVQTQLDVPTDNQIQEKPAGSSDEQIGARPAETLDVTQEASIDHDGNGVTCLDQHKMAERANEVLGGIGMEPIGSGNMEEDLRACVAAEKTADRDDVLRGHGLGPNAGPLPPNIADPDLTPRLPPNIAKPIEPSFS